MATSITLRSTKGSALTHSEMDANLTNLQTTADAAKAATDTLTSDKAEATALGVANTDQNMGSFTGTTIADNVSAKVGMQSLETAVETKANASAVGVTSAAANMGTYIGTTITANQTAKQNLQELETAVEARAVSATLAASGGAALIGVADGANVQQAIAVAATPAALIASASALPVGATVRTVNGFLYTVASAGAVDHHITTAGGVKLYADLRFGLDPRALGAPADGVGDDAPYVEDAWGFTKSVILSQGFTYRFASVIGIPDQDLYAATQHTLTGVGARVILDGVAAGDAILTSAAAKAAPESTSNLFTGKVLITGINWTQSSQSTLINGDRIYNVRVTQNHFDGLHALAKSYRNHVGHANGYFQSVFVTDNTFSDCEWFIHGYKGYNVVFANNMCERCTSGIRLLDTVQIFSAHNLRVTNNLYEGGGQFLRVGNTIGGVFTGNYLESNTIGDMPTEKCNLNLTYGNTQPFDNRGSWFFAGNSFQNHSTQTADATFFDIVIDQGLENVTFGGGDWSNARLTAAAITSSQGTYNRGAASTPYILPRPAQAAGRDYISSSLVRPLSTFLSGGAFNYMRLQLGSYVDAVEYRPFTMDLNVKLELENAANEVFAVASFDAKLLLTPVGSGMFGATGRFAPWTVTQVVSNLMQQNDALDIDTATSTKTGLMFPTPANFTAGTISRVSTYLECRVNGFVTPTITGRSAPTQVRTHISGWVNGLSRQAGTANRWLSLIN